MKENICRFVRARKTDDTLHTIHFVYQREADFRQDYLVTATCTLALVTAGSGVLHMPMGAFPLERGMLFMTFPAKPYYIENTGSLQYLYIGFAGGRVPGLLERIQLTPVQPVLAGFDGLIPLWEQSLEEAAEENLDLLCEGLLLQCLGLVCRDLREKACADGQNRVLLAKEYVDVHYGDCELNLNAVSARFGYHPKHFSAAFKKLVRVNFTEYVRQRRLEQAVSLIESGITNVQDLAELCGYRDAAYFSKSFRQVLGESPKRWILRRWQKRQ